MTSASDSSRDAVQWMGRTFALTAAVKLLLACAVPFTTDEAYFVLWGRNPDYGYYDHGAMTGWWLWLMLQVSDAAWWLRLPALLTSHVVGWVLWRLLRPLDATKAAWAVVLYLVSPVSMFHVLITTDTPLQFFSAVSVWFAVRGVRHERAIDLLLSGAALGLAFLSKYFAVLLGVSYAVLFLGCLGRPRVRSLLLLLAGIVPGVGINLAWNHEHWWVNVLFNLVTRHQSSGFSPFAPLVYLFTLAALAGPGVLLGILRRHPPARVPWREAWPRLRADGTIAMVVACAFPLAAFLLVSLRATIGVHWVLSFFPFLAAVLVVRDPVADLRRMIRPTLWWTGVPVALVLLTALVLPRLAPLHRSAFAIVMAAEPRAVLEALEPFRNQYLLTTPSYVKSSLFGYHLKHNVPVIGVGSYHARQDDLLTDFRTFEGRDLMIVTERRRDLASLEAWFDRVEVRELSVHGARFYVALGERFNFRAYRKLVLTEIVDRYYRLPDWLRPLAAPCFFTVRYDLPPPPPA